jgi:MFS family permease
VSGLLLACAFAACFFVFYDRGELGAGTDALDHVSFVRRSVESGALFPRDSYYREGDGASPDPRKGLWHPVLSRWARDANAPADRVWRMVPSCAAFFALCVLYGFAASLAGPGLVALLAVALFLVFGAGEGAAWFTKIGFSRNVALVLLWADVRFIVRWCRSRRRADLAAAAFVAAAGAAFHVAFALQALAVLLGMLCFVLASREGRAWRAPFALSAAATAAAMAIPLALRSAEAGVAHNVVHTHRQGMLVLTETLAVVDPAEVATRLGPAFFFLLAAAPFYYLYTKRVERRSLALYLFAAPVVLVCTPFIASAMERFLGYLHYRMLDAAPVAVLLGITLAGLSRAAFGGGAFRRGAPSSPAGRIFALAALAVFAWYPLRVGMRTAAAGIASAFGTPAAIEARYASLFAAIETRVPPGGVIATDPRTSYIVSAFTDRFVAVTLDQHGSPSDPLALERLRGIRDLMSPAVPASAGAAWLEAAGAAHVIVDESAGPDDDFFGSMPPGGGSGSARKLESCPALYRRVFEIEGFHFFEVARGSGAKPGDPGCGAPLAEPPACAGAGEIASAGGPLPGEDRLLIDNPIDAGSGIVLSRAVIDRFTLRTIDTLTGYFCWKAGRAVPYGLPLEVTIRLDGASRTGERHRAWYGKQYRRFVERRQGVFHRATWTVRLRSGEAAPDLWPPGESVRQDFAVPIPHALSPGAYELRIKVRRTPYLPVRTVADYLSNDDSLQGTAIGMIYVQ